MTAQSRGRDFEDHAFRAEAVYLFLGMLMTFITSFQPCVLTAGRPGVSTTTVEEAARIGGATTPKPSPNASTLTWKRNCSPSRSRPANRRGIRVPIYITVQWDHYTATRHPEWAAHHAEGRVIGTPSFEAGFYRMLCLNTRYREFLKEHTAELLNTFPTDGLFFDIVWPVACTFRYCREKRLTVFEVERIDGHAMVSLTFG